jgi:hypothetical protein
VKAFVSLHTKEPKSQIDNEVSYEGYKRIEIDYFDNFALQPINLVFPEIPETQEASIKYIAIGSAGSGKGEIHKAVHSMPYIPLDKETRPQIILCDEITFPEGINPIARTIYELVYRKYIAAEDLHPALYEIVNIELQKVGMPVIPCIRSGASHMKSCFSSLSELGKMLGNA